MKTTIRTGVFETNSSSAHTLVIADHRPDGIDYTQYWSNGGCFGRYESLSSNDTSLKLDYLWQAIIDNSDELDSGEGAGSISWWQETIATYLPEARLEIEYDSSGYPKGYIDHGGAYADMLEAMYQDPELIARFLLSPDSWIFLSSDEDYKRPDYPDCDYIEFDND